MYSVRVYDTLSSRTAPENSPKAARETANGRSSLTAVLSVV